MHLSDGECITFEFDASSCLVFPKSLRVSREHIPIEIFDTPNYYWLKSSSL